MTEPEELDEDLFADLYDADEPTATATAAPVTQPKPDLEPAEPAPPVLADPPTVDVKDEDTGGGHVNVAEQSQGAYANGEDDREQSRWDNNGRGSRMDVAVEQDSGAIGIKEDG
ncbi:MAG: hypothetical protein Q9223_005640 [Gallowayella weberi]